MAPKICKKCGEMICIGITYKQTKKGFFWGKDREWLKYDCHECGYTWDIDIKEKQ
jgi:RNase P subunit RPR2